MNTIPADQLIVAIATTAILGMLFLPAILSSITTPQKPEEYDEEDWNLLTQGIEGAGRTIGCLERFLFLVAIIEGNNALLLIPAWLAFKVATKWQSWSTIVQVGEMDLPSLPVRRTLGSYTVTRSLVGVLSNILIAVGGKYIGTHYGNWLQCVA